MKHTALAWWVARLGLAAALVAIVWVAARPVIPPDPVHASAPEDAFSAERAMEELRVVARAPHQAGSAAQARVREYILSRAKALGLPAEVQRRAGVESPAWGGWSGTIENVIVRVPGTRSSARDVLITAHYDSVPVGPGAGDDGVSVAAMLETMRALEAGPPENDVVFLFTDGEEMGWLGVKAFVRHHPEMGDVGIAFAFEGWPLMGKGRISPKAEQRAHQLARAVRELSPKTTVQSELYADALGRMDVFRENRALGTTEVREGIPSVVWVVMVSGALITVGFTYLFAMRSFKLHAVATGALTIVVVLLLFTVGVLDHAYDGDVRVGPGAFELALKEMKQ